MLRQTNQRPLLAYFDAIKGLRFRQLSLILKSGYDPNLMLNGRGQNGLQYMVHYFAASEAHMMRLEIPAARAAYLNIAKLLLDAGLDPNATDILTGESVIFDAIKLNDRELVGLLLHYVDLSLRNKDGETALMCASRFGCKQTLRLILAHLHDLDLDEFYLRQRNRFGMTALDLARAENIDCAKLLAKHLIALGHPTNSLLTRSSSHHQLNLARHALLRRPLVAPVVGPVVATRSTALQRTLGGTIDDPLASDCDSVVDYGLMGLTGRGSQAIGQRAADFNRYLMKRNETLGTANVRNVASFSGGGGQWASSSSGQQQQQASCSTDDDDYEAEYNSDLGGGFGGGFGGGNVGAGSMMTRSRSSCNLAASSAPEKKHADGAGINQQQAKYGQSSSSVGQSSSSKKTSK